MTAMECATEAQIKSCFDGSLDEDDGGSSEGRRKKRSSSSNGQNMAMYLPTAKFLAKELEDWVQVKKFDDGFDTLRSTECEIPKDDTTCGCECDKVNKVQTSIFQGLFQFPYSNVQVKVHKMFKILSILDNFKIQQLGDVLEWFFRGFLKVDNLDMAK